MHSAKSTDKNIVHFCAYSKPLSNAINIELTLLIRFMLFIIVRISDVVHTLGFCVNATFGTVEEMCYLNLCL